MRVKFLMGVKHQGNSHAKDDQMTVDDVTGAYFCENGWVEDLDGKVKTAAVDVNRKVVLDIDNVKHGTSKETK